MERERRQLGEIFYLLGEMPARQGMKLKLGNEFERC